MALRYHHEMSKNPTKQSTENTPRDIRVVDGVEYDLTLKPNQKGNQWAKYNAAQHKLGRPKGSQNAMTVDMQQHVREAFSNLGGVQYLEKLGREHPELFIRLVVRLMPTTIEAEVRHTVGDIIDRIGAGRQRLVALRDIAPASTSQLKGVIEGVVSHESDEE